MSLQTLRISQFPIASANEIDDDIWMIFNTKDNQTKRMQAGNLKLAHGCNMMCHDVLIQSADVLTMGTTPVLAGITVPAGYAINLLSGALWISYNTTAYATETDLMIQPVTGSTELVTLATVLGTFLDMSGSFTPSAVNPLEQRIVTGSDLMITTPAGVDPTGGDSDVNLKLYYTLIQL